LKKPIPPPKPGHLKVTRAVSNQEMGPSKPLPEKPRKYSEAGDPANRVAPPNVPPPVNYFLTLLLPRVLKIKIQGESQLSFCKILKYK